MTSFFCLVGFVTVYSMNSDNIKAAQSIVPFVRETGICRFEKNVSTLLSCRKLPDDGWSDPDIEMFMLQLSQLDSNSFAVGVGEREGRIFSRLVRDRCFGMAHGMGRSGNLGAAQPKAAGSSLVVTLSNLFAVQMLKEAGETEVKDACVVPVCTGMSMFLCLSSLRNERPKSKYVVWCRCDQKSAIKAVHLCGLELVVINGVMKGEAIVTNLEEIRAKIESLGAENICCILSTTSCFAPRVCDDIEEISRICKEKDVAHLINNAYGVQSRDIMKKISRSTRVGRVDGYVQSTDKNWCIPVGGGVIAGRIAPLANAQYSGRASSSPIIDFFITALSMGMKGWKNLLQERELLFRKTGERFEREMEHFRLLKTPDNPISYALAFEAKDDPKMLGSMLFTRGLTGQRVCVRSEKISNPDGMQEFKNWGQHIDVYEPAICYMTFAVAIGSSEEDIEKAIGTLRKTMKEFKKKEEKKKEEKKDKK